MKLKITPGPHSTPIRTQWNPSPGFIRAVAQALKVDPKHAQLAIDQIGETTKRMGYDISKIPENQLLMTVIMTNNKLNRVNTPQTGQPNG